MNTWILGDIHGAYKALKQVFEQAPVQKGDTIITLGDIVDGWSEVYECVQFLIDLEKDYTVINCKGNHDEWFNIFLQSSRHPCDWLQGGIGTLTSYCKNLDKEYHIKMSGFITNLLNTDIPTSHKDFFRKQIKYYKDDDNNLFVHGGFNRHYLLLEHTDESIFWWDRDLWMTALSYKEMPGMNNSKSKFKIKEQIKEIFIGHTSTTNWKKEIPMRAVNIWNLDTGAGFGSGKLTIMNVKTKEYWQSDPVNSLYINEKGRDY